MVRGGMGRLGVLYRTPNEAQTQRPTLKTAIHTISPTVERVVILYVLQEP